MLVGRLCVVVCAVLALVLGGLAAAGWPAPPAVARATGAVAACLAAAVALLAATTAANSKTANSKTANSKTANSKIANKTANSKTANSKIANSTNSKTANTNNAGSRDYPAIRCTANTIDVIGTYTSHGGGTVKVMQPDKPSRQYWSSAADALANNGMPADVYNNFSKNECTCEDDSPLHKKDCAIVTARDTRYLMHYAYTREGHRTVDKFAYYTQRTIAGAKQLTRVVQFIVRAIPIQQLKEICKTLTRMGINELLCNMLCKDIDTYTIDTICKNVVVSAIMHPRYTTRTNHIEWLHYIQPISSSTTYLVQKVIHDWCALTELYSHGSGDSVKFIKVALDDSNEYANILQYLYNTRIATCRAADLVAQCFIMANTYNVAKQVYKHIRNTIVVNLPHTTKDSEKRSPYIILEAFHKTATVFKWGHVSSSYVNEQTTLNKGFKKFRICVRAAKYMTDRSANNITFPKKWAMADGVTKYIAYRVLLLIVQDMCKLTQNSTWKNWINDYKKHINDDTQKVNSPADIRDWFRAKKGTSIFSSNNPRSQLFKDIVSAYDLKYPTKKQSNKSTPPSIQSVDTKERSEMRVTRSTNIYTLANKDSAIMDKYDTILQRIISVLQSAIGCGKVSAVFEILKHDYDSAADIISNATQVYNWLCAYNHTTFELPPNIGKLNAKFREVYEVSRKLHERVYAITRVNPDPAYNFETVLANFAETNTMFNGPRE